MSVITCSGWHTARHHEGIIMNQVNQAKSKEMADQRIAIRVSTEEHRRIATLALAQGTSMKDVLLSGLAKAAANQEAGDELGKMETRLQNSIQQLAQQIKDQPRPSTQHQATIDLEPIKATLGKLVEAVNGQTRTLKELPAPQPLTAPPKLDTSKLESLANQLQQAAQALQKTQQKATAAQIAPSVTTTLKGLIQDRAWLKWAAMASSLTLMISAGLGSFLWWQSHEIEHNTAILKTQQAAISTAAALGIQIGQEQGGGAWFLLPKGWKLASNPYQYEGRMAVNIGPSMR